MSNRKLVVQVVSAHNLLPKDDQGSCSSYVELHFDNQIFWTTIKEKDLDPAWNETFYFNISDPNNLSGLTLDAYVYNNVKANHFRSCLGKVSINGTSFVPYSGAVILHYPLQKKSVFSSVKSKLGLKVFFTDNPSIRSSNPLPAMESSMYTNSYPNAYPTQAEATPQQLPNFVPSAPPIDFSPVDLSIPNVEDEEASRTNEAIDGDGSSSCVICWEAPVQGACIPCGHMAGCMSCLNELKMKKGDCPVCRAKINQVIRLYAV